MDRPGSRSRFTEVCSSESLSHSLALQLVAEDRRDILDDMRERQWSPTPMQRHELLLIACKTNASASAALLVTMGAQPNDGYPERKQRIDSGMRWGPEPVPIPIRAAALSGSAETLRALFANGGRYTALTAPAMDDALEPNAPAKERRTDIVGILLEHGWRWDQAETASVTSRTISKKRTNWLHAAALCSPDSLRLLLTSGPTASGQPLSPSDVDLIGSYHGNGSGVTYLSHESVSVLLQHCPIGMYAPGLDEQGRLPCERPGSDGSAAIEVRRLLLGYSLCGDTTGERTDAACALLTESARDELRLRGLSALSWSPTSCAAKMLGALGADDRTRAVQTLSARFLHGASRGKEADAKALGQLSALTAKQGWSQVA